VTTPAPLLEVDRLSVRHGQLRALSEVSFTLYPQEVFAVIGANGAGKSTLLRTVAGLHPAASGRVLLDGADLTRTPAAERLAAGIALVPEGRRLFPSLSVEENLKVGAHRARKGPFDLARVYELFPWMLERRRQRAARLSGGEQQAVAIGRALVSNPRLLLLDELSLGLAPLVVQRIYGLLPELLDAGVTVLLVEQDVAQAVRAADRVQCLLEGRTTLEGTPTELTRQQIEAAYFGLERPTEGEAALR
jgi:branched-chain amino acid transport system ATP-binding protein